MNNEPMFELFGLQVTPYALSVALALVMGIAALALVCHRDGLKGGTAALCAAFCLLLGPRAARLGYCLVRIRHYLEIGLENVLRPGEGEFMLLGAVAGCALAGWLTAGSAAASLSVSWKKRCGTSPKSPRPAKNPQSLRSFRNSIIGCWRPKPASWASSRRNWTPPRSPWKGCGGTNTCG